MKRALSRKNLLDRLSHTVKCFLGPVLGTVSLPYLLGRRFRENRRFIRHAEKWPAEQARAYQLDALRRLCTLAYAKTSYYRRTFDAVGFHPEDMKSAEAFSALATTDRDTVRAHLEEMCARPVDHPSVDHCSTGGASGVPLFFYMGSERSAIEYAYLIASFARVGYRPRMPMAVLRGRLVRPDGRGLHHEYDPILRHHYYSNFHMTDENMGRYLAHIATIGPCFLHVYPSSVAALARFIRRAGVKAPGNIRGIIAESETVYPEQRQMVEEVFGCRHFSCYGHSEKLVLAAECEFSTDYHVWPTYGYFELLDEQGRPVTTPGQRGEIVGTGFINTVMPFIRYRTGDYATYVGDHCEACGRQHTIIRDIRGHRTQEMLVAADGSEISWTALNMHDDTFLHVRQFQFYQSAPGQAVLRVAPAEGFGDEDRRRIQQNLGRKLDGRVTFAIELVESIPLSPRGKAIYVDQRIKEPHAPEGPA
jgi:phenylacetate-CoA ligase